MKEYKFSIALVTLNHLGRNLYRSFNTILGEAISNSWDADATEVNIEIDRENNSLLIYDNGIGMTDQDFREKFLEVGYRRREEGGRSSRTGRTFIGGKGIGKLALLSCSKRLSILSKADGEEIIGGVIDNASLDQAIKGGQNVEEYTLPSATEVFISKYRDLLGEHGTLLLFEELNDGIKHRIPYIRTQIALYFRFALVDPTFKIKVNDKEIGVEELSPLANKTEFVWGTKDLNDPYIESFKNLKEKPFILPGNSDKPLFKGFIASVEKPSHLKIKEVSDERVSIDLFVNGRLRERDILKRIGGSSSARIPANYLYGQIHCDQLDDGGLQDRFTSSREGVLEGDPIMEKLTRELQPVLEKIMGEWDKLRLKHREEGDPENKAITLKERKALDLFNILSKDYDSIADKQVEKWLSDIRQDAQYNLESYGDCFIAENLMRSYLREQGGEKDSEVEKSAKGHREKAEKDAEALSLRYSCRLEAESNLSYLGVSELLRFALRPSDQSKDPSSEQSEIFSVGVFKHIRNAVAHTCRLTPEAKEELTKQVISIKDQLKAKIKELK